jgi:hypothetical protein
MSVIPFPTESEDPKVPGEFSVRPPVLTRSKARRPVLLRKEVIQPQVPLRLPCYDFIPVTAHTLDGVAAGFGYKRLP